MAATLTSKRITARDEAEAVELAFAEGWSDGLPVVPPTEARGPGHAGGGPARARTARSPSSPTAAVAHHGREGRDQRGHGRLPAGVHAGGRGGGRGDRRPPLELPRPGHLHGRRRRADDRQRADRPRARHQRRRQPVRAGLARQPHHRPCRAPGHAQRVRLDARAARPRHARPSRQALVRDRRERGGEPVDAAARRARLPARAEHGDRDRLRRRRASSTTSSRTPPRASSPRWPTTCGSPAS